MQADTRSADHTVGVPRVEHATHERPGNPTSRRRPAGHRCGGLPAGLRWQLCRRLQGRSGWCPTRRRRGTPTRSRSSSPSPRRCRRPSPRKPFRTASMVWPGRCRYGPPPGRRCSCPALGLPRAGPRSAGGAGRVQAGGVAPAPWCGSSGRTPGSCRPASPSPGRSRSRRSHRPPPWSLSTQSISGELMIWCSRMPTSCASIPDGVITCCTAA